MIEDVVNRLNGKIEEVKHEAIKRIRDKVEPLKQEGEELYLSPIVKDGLVIWLGKVKDPEGTLTGGGLFQEGYFRSAYKIEIEFSNIEGSNRKHINVLAEITEISRDELIDLLYEYKFSQIEENIE